MTNQWPQGNDERRRLENDIFELRPELKTAVRQIRDQLAALEDRPGSSIARFEQSLGNSRNRANTNGEITRQSAHDRNGEQIPRGEARAMPCPAAQRRSEEHTSGLQSLMRISNAVFCLKKKKT